MPLVHQKLGGVTDTVHLAQPLTLSLSYSECEFVCLFVTVLIAFFVKKQSLQHRGAMASAEKDVD